MPDIYYLDRQNKKEEKEQVYGNFFIDLLYGPGFLSWIFSFSLLPLVCRIPLVSRLYGYFQKSRLSKYKIKPFIKTFQVDESEFLESVDTFQSFNDFFIRKLKPTARPIANGNDVAVLPADGRYLFYSNVSKTDNYLIKGTAFSLEELLQSKALSDKYAQGSMVIARLCPTDYHRFHFPCNCVPDEPKLVNGPLFSVNPLALKKNVGFLTQNKRVMTTLHTKNFGTVLYIEVGATYVGSIVQTFVPKEHHAKGDEKGYFSFGGSCLILLFEPSQIEFDQDLLDATCRSMEIRGLLGQSMGRALSPL